MKIQKSNDTDPTCRLLELLASVVGVAGRDLKAGCSDGRRGREASCECLLTLSSGIYRYAEIDIEPPAGYEPPPPRIEEVPVAQPLVAVGILADEE